MTSIERCPNPQMGPSHHPDIEAFITSMCNQACHQILSFLARGVSEKPWHSKGTLFPWAQGGHVIVGVAMN